MQDRSLSTKLFQPSFFFLVRTFGSYWNLVGVSFTYGVRELLSLVLFSVSLSELLIYSFFFRKKKSSLKTSGPQASRVQQRREKTCVKKSSLERDCSFNSSQLWSSWAFSRLGLIRCTWLGQCQPLELATRGTPLVEMGGWLWGRGSGWPTKRELKEAAKWWLGKWRCLGSLTYCPLVQVVVEVWCPSSAGG